MFQPSRGLLAVLLLLTVALLSPGPVLAGAVPHGVHDHGEGHPSSPAPARRGKKGKTADEGVGQKEKEDEDWKVDAPAGQPMRDVTLDVDEGTWLSLDVSPDGSEIVFDLLGDLYTLPMEGGEARSLTSGLAWDMQPRYSPDGRWIAFTSDRSGGDNIWIVKRDGSDPQQVTKESFRLLNSPAWTPDSEFIAARKHFTGRRSLGAGEIWLYHRSGGGGLQMTEKPNDQQDVGEPVFSPDGRYLYYSQDTTQGPFFQYNKDPNTQIYEIFRLDREDGQTESLLGGAGGAVRPTPSPDGQSMAYVRRVRAKSVLYVHDLRSGVERPLYDGLDRDMQETWAVHGVYPTMAWTPDSRQIVFWAGGKFHRIDVETAEVTPIPFRVRDSRQVLEVVRFPQEVAPETFDVKMLRWVQVSPKGDQVLYQSLGKIWLRDLPDGDLRRLTRQDDHLEFYPSFSRDGRWVVYTTWDDEKLGSLRVAEARGGVSRTLTDQPGHYVEPAFSPDGDTVVYRRSGGGFLRSPLWSRDAGLYAVPARGGESTKILANGGAPQFAESSERVYFTAFGAGGKRLLKSVELDGSDERTHFSSAKATEYRLSHDGLWLAYSEGFDAFITPFPRTGKTIDVGPKASAIPQAKVTRDAGEYLHWSGDGKALHWALGAELFTRELSDAFSFMDGAPEELPEAPEHGLPIGFEAHGDRPEGTVALVGGKVITMRGDEVLEDGVVIVEGHRIQAVGRRGEVAVPAGAHVVDVAGKTVMPGIVDVHWHGSQGTEEMTAEESWVNLASLAFGVTTIHDPSNDTSEIFAAAEMQRAGRLTAPRIFSTGTILYGADAPFTAVIDSLEDARSHLRRMKAVGAFSVKSYNQPRRDQRQQVIAAARELEMMVVPEGGSLFQHNMTMVADGHTGIEHSIPVGAIYDDVLQFWGGTEVAYSPTLGVGYGGLWGENYWYAKTDVWANERLLTFVPRRFVDARSRRPVHAPDEEWGHFYNARAAKELADAGVWLCVGAHGQREGLAAHWELWMFHQGGMSEHEALRAATLNGALYLGLDGDIGSLEPGKLADLIVIDGDPLSDIRSTEKVTHTMLNGRLYDAATMNQVGNDPQERGKLWFEEAP